MKLAAFDLDNCLANDLWRMPLIDWTQTNPDKRYDKYHMMCGQDLPGNTSLVAALAGQAQPAFLTARPEGVRATTVRWIRQHLPCHDFILLMRPTACHESSVTLKRRMASDLARMGHSVVAAFDDREDVVRMYRDIGIPAARLWIHDVCAMTPPTNKEIHHHAV